MKVVDEKHDRGEVKIHYIGFGRIYNEWIRKSQIQYVPTATTCVNSCAEAGEDQFFATLTCELKRKLVPDRHEDPVIQIQLACNNNNFAILKSKGVITGRRVKGQQEYAITNFSDLNDLLGESWHIRVYNINGDFSKVVLNTVRFHAMQPKAIMDFNVTIPGVISNEPDTGDELRRAKLIPYFIQQPSAVVFQCVKKDGNKK